MPGPRIEDLSDTWGEELLSLQKEISSDFEKHNSNCKVLLNAPAVDKIDSIPTKMIEFEPLLVLT